MMYRSNDILTLVPPNDDGEKILKQALFFQNSLGMRIFILNIIEKPSFFEKIFHAKKLPYIKKEALNDQYEFVKKVIGKELPKNLIIRVKAGKLLPILFAQSKKGGYEFMIIDKSESPDGLSRYETDKIISRSHCPVLTINKEYHVNEVKKIIIPVNISQSTQKKLLWATYFAQKFNAKIKIVSALNINIPLRNSLAWKNAEKLKYMLYERGIECEVKILKTQSREKYKIIQEYIKEENPGLVIIRTHQKSNMSGTQIGKFVSEIVHRCKMPVFTVNRFMYPMPIDFEY